MTKYCTLNELAEIVQGEVAGDGALEVCGLNGVDLAGDNEITFVTNNKMLNDLAGSKAAACIVPQGFKEIDLPLIKVKNPEYAAAVIHNHFLAEPFKAQGIHKSAYVGNDCRISEEVSIGPLAVIGNRVQIEGRATIYPGVVIGNNCVIGEDTTLYPNVTVAADTVIGRRVIIHAGASIGSDGFGFASDPATGTHIKKPQVGNVRIDDDVEIGANSCVDRAAFGTTRIRSGTKIDNLVMIAHNVDIGENSILVGQVGIAGSTSLGRNVIIGGQAGIAGHLRIKDHVMVAAMSGVHSNLKEGSVVGGTPAFEIRKWGKATAAYSRLPDMYRELRRLTKEVDRLTGLSAERNEEHKKEGEE